MRSTLPPLFTARSLLLAVLVLTTGSAWAKQRQPPLPHVTRSEPPEVPPVPSAGAAVPQHEEPVAPDHQLEQATAATEPLQRELIAYKTESGRRLPLISHGAYQAARVRWTAGFATTLCSLAVLGTGVGALLLGSQGQDSLTDHGRTQAMATGGVLTGIGAAGSAAGIVIWALARRDLLRIEDGLPAAVQDRAQPAVSLAPSPGGAGLVLGLSGSWR